MLEQTMLRRLAPLLLVLVVLSSCRSDPTPQPPATASPGVTVGVSPSAPASPVDPATAALAAYRAMWKAFISAADVADPGLPSLAQYADQRALQTLRDGVQDMKDKGLINTGDVKLLSPKVTALATSVKPIRVEISDCVDTSATRLVKRDGSAYNDTPGGRRAMQATVVQQSDGGWKVTEFGLREVGSCQGS